MGLKKETPVVAKKKAAAKKQTAPKRTRHPGMMGDGTEEQNLSQRGQPGARIRQAEVKAVFGKKK